MVIEMYHNIIIRMPNWIGDAVMATPLLEDVHRHFPHAQITAMCQGKVGELLIGNPHIHEIFSFSKANEFTRHLDTRDLIHRLRQGKYDLGILLPNSFSSAWWFWRGKVKERLGFTTDGRSFLLTQKIPIPRQKGHEHLVMTYKRLLTPLGIPLSDSNPSIFVTKEERAAAQSLMLQYGIPKDAILIGVNPGAAFGSAKCWPPDRFRKLAERLLENEKIYLLFFGDVHTASLVHSICCNLSSRVIDLSNRTTLRELISFISCCNLFLTNDSGPMHLAAALKVPLIALFGSTDPFVTGPYRNGIVIRKDNIACSPCFKRVCPIDFKCMKRIEVEEVYRAINNLLLSHS